MEKMNCIVVDDENMGRKLLEENVRQIPFLNLVASCKNAFEAMEVLQKEKVDLIFLDIQMPDLLGTELVKLLPKGTQVIFTTAFSEYAVEGFSLRAVDFLLKPISFPRFLEACNRALENRTQRNSTNDYIFVKDGHDWIKIIWNDILFIQSDGNLLYIHEKDRKVITK